MIGADIEVSMQREVWFQKIAWSYVPCHWKGFAAIAAVIFPTLAAIILGQLILAGLGYGDADGLVIAVFLIPALVIMLGIAKRHS